MPIAAGTRVLAGQIACSKKVSGGQPSARPSPAGWEGIPTWPLGDEGHAWRWVGRLDEALGVRIEAIAVRYRSKIIHLRRSACEPRFLVAGTSQRRRGPSLLHLLSRIACWGGDGTRNSP